MTEIADLLPNHTRSHYTALRVVDSEKKKHEFDTQLGSLLRTAAARGHVRSGGTLKAEWDLKAALLDSLAEGSVEAAIETCKLYDVELTPALCIAIESATEDTLSTWYRLQIQNGAAGVSGLHIPNSSIQAISSRQFAVMPRIKVLLERARVEDAARREELAKRFTYKPPKQFAIGANVRILNPGIDGIVTQMDDERTVMSQYWHTVDTKYGERREPGSNLELIPKPITHPKPPQPKIADNIYLQHNARLNLNSTDNSTNVAVSDHAKVFDALNTQAASIADAIEREKIVAAIAEMEAAHGSGGFLAAYQRFMSIASDHITVFAPLLPMLAQLLTGHH